MYIKFQKQADSAAFELVRVALAATTAKVNHNTYLVTSRVRMILSKLKWANPVSSHLQTGGSALIQHRVTGQTMGRDGASHEAQACGLEIHTPLNCLHSAAADPTICALFKATQGYVCPVSGCAELKLPSTVSRAADRGMASRYGG